MLQRMCHSYRTVMQCVAVWMSSRTCSNECVTSHTCAPTNVSQRNEPVVAHDSTNVSLVSSRTCNVSLVSSRTCSNQCVTPTNVFLYSSFREDKGEIVWSPISNWIRLRNVQLLLSYIGRGTFSKSYICVLHSFLTDESCYSTKLPSLWK